MPTSKPKKIRAPGTKRYASARKSDLLGKERPRPLSASANLPVGGESASVRPPSQSLSPADSSEEEYTSSEDESDYSDEEEELGDMRTLEEASDVLLSVVDCASETLMSVPGLEFPRRSIKNPPTPHLVLLVVVVIFLLFLTNNATDSPRATSNGCCRGGELGCPGHNVQSTRSPSDDGGEDESCYGVPSLCRDSA